MKCSDYEDTIVDCQIDSKESQNSNGIYPYRMESLKSLTVLKEWEDVHGDYEPWYQTYLGTELAELIPLLIWIILFSFVFYALGGH